MSNVKFTPVRGTEANIATMGFNNGYVYFATDTVIIFAFLMLLQAKVRHIICDYESG